MNTTIANIINNDENTYQGNLRYYFKIVFNAPNIHSPYHNFRHMVHVMWQVYDAIKYYSLGPEEARALLIAALFHDYGHEGISGDDSKNINKAIVSIRNFILKEDLPLLLQIEDLISATEYPHNEQEVSKSAKILRDADMSQAFDNAWIQQVTFGLAKESGTEPVVFFEKQINFLMYDLKFSTEWGQRKFSKKRDEKITEIRSLLELIQ